MLGCGATRMNERFRPLIERIWRYHQLEHQLARSDAIITLCSHDTVVAERAAQLFFEGWAPLLIFSGGRGAVTRHLFHEPEADLFARIAAAMGVPRDCILTETRSTNTGENVLFTRQMLADLGVEHRAIIAVQKPYMERRTYATFRKLWPEAQVVVTSPRASLDEYLARYSHRSLTVDDVISIMVGDLQRIRLYPERGFQVPQQIPDDVWEAFNALVDAGYDRHLVEPD